MKTLLIFFMAIAAINAFFLSDNARDEFIERMENIFSRVRNYGHQGIPVPQNPPVKFSDMKQTIEIWESLSDEERSAIKNHLFGVKYPRPTPAHHMERPHIVLDEETLKEMHEKWEKMTPEERQQIIDNKRKARQEDFEHLRPDFIQRFPRPMPGHHQHLSEEKLKEMRDKITSMTPEEREEFRNNLRKHHESMKGRQFQGIRTLPYPNDFPNLRPMPDNLRPVRPIGRPQPMPEFESDAPRSRPVDWISRPVFPNAKFQPIMPLSEVEPASFFQQIKPLPEFESDAPRTRPVDWISRPVLPNGRFQPIMPLAANIDEEKSQNLHELFPNGLPIRPIGIAAADNVIIEKFSDETIEDEDDQEMEIVPIKPAKKFVRPQGPIQRPVPRPMPEDNQVKPAPRPNNRPQFFPKPENGDLPESGFPRPRPNQRPNHRPDVDNDGFPIASPRQFIPILPIRNQPILPLDSQPIMPIPDYLRRNIS